MTDLLAGLARNRYQLSARHAPLLFQAADAGDRVAQDCIRWAGQELGSQAIGVIRQRMSAGSPPRNEYRLTRKGVEYYPVLLMLMRWGDRYYVSPEGPPVILKHKGCGEALNPQVVCSCCRAPIRPQDVTYEIVERRAAA